MKKKSNFKVQNSKIIEKAKRIKLLVLDVDGVMTDGRIILDNKDNEIKAFHVRDGHGIKMALNTGIKIAIITGRKSRVVERRARELGIKDVYQKATNKVDTFVKMIKKYGLKDEESAFIADDLNDLPLLRRVGLSFSVADADAHIKNVVNYVSEKGGGQGAVREVIDIILKAQGNWENEAERI